MKKKINITSGAIEKGLELAKEFVDKLIMPSVEETGLLLKDQIVRWRFNNQIKMLNKAQFYCKKNNIKLKQISLKLLLPLLDYSSIEEDEILQDKWAVLLSNLVDAEQNLENHVFPYILSQLSKSEFAILERAFDNKRQEREVLDKMTKDSLWDNKSILRFDKQIREKIRKETEDRITEIETEIREQIKNYNRNFCACYTMGEEKKKKIGDKIKIRNRKTEKGTEIRGQIIKSDILYSNLLNYEGAELEKAIRNAAMEKFKEEGKEIINEWKEAEFEKNEHTGILISIENLKSFELSNLVRLGLVKELKSYNLMKNPVKQMEQSDNIKADIDLDMNSKTERILTELGVLFIKACKEKNETKNCR